MASQQKEQSQSVARESQSGARGTNVEQPSSIEQDRAARQRQRELNEQAYQESIKGQELPPSVVEAQGQERERRRQDEEAAEAGRRDLEETTRRISEQGKE